MCPAVQQDEQGVSDYHSRKELHVELRFAGNAYKLSGTRWVALALRRS